MITINVIIATRNRSAELKHCLKGLFRQETDGSFSFEVIVADNNSTDDTHEIVRAFEKEFPGRIRYVLESRAGKCVALNTAIADAKGDILAFTDDDVEIDPKWLLNLVRCFREQSCDGVGGRILPVFPSQAPNWVKDNVALLAGPIVVYDHGEETKVYQKPTYEFLGANYAFKRQVFVDCGLFRTDIGPGKATFGDDTEFVNRALKAGKKLFYCGQAVIWHPVDTRRMNLGYIARWNIALGRYRVIVDDHGEIDRSIVYWFGVPRYLIGNMLSNVKQMICSLFNSRCFLIFWIDLFRNWGKAMEIKKIYNKSC